MKITLTIAAILSFFLSASTFAATEITAQQAMQQQRVSVGAVSLGHNVVSPDDATSQVSKLADERGATAYQIIAMHEPGGNSSIQINAVLYR
ncbi:hypothetical protein PL78_12865 [Yersinia entomophaga]|uniref:YdgH/BhsA/McbA-like domain-containing protein n=1 Tax=Yersinia entomophaga TaxID=935293 RepID=A0ABN4PV15_YERET|nr:MULTISPECIES: DUF1471 domain-containing protein [Yersinia]ANI30709.1 hypothetical protein PL78_12865 [Yersinia entomophaga]OWF85622.1 hypothetical protein B4914_16905 [Yersinia entomophaga]